MVRRSDDGYELVAGERRLRAAAQAGLERVPVVIRDLNDEEAAEVSLIENIQREDLNPIEKAQAFKRLMEEFGLSQDEVSERVGHDRSTIANFVRLLQLPAAVQESVSRGTLSMGHARALIPVPDAGRQIQLAKDAGDKGFSVRELEQAVRDLLDRPIKQMKRPVAQRATVHHPMSPDDQYLVNMAQRHLGTKVRLRRSGHGGEFTVEFYSDTDLDRILRAMGVLQGHA